MGALVLEQDAPLRAFGEALDGSMLEFSKLVPASGIYPFTISAPMSTMPELDPLLHELYAALKALYGVRLERLVLYGSHARGQAHSDSDVDVLVVLEGEVDHPGREIDRMMDTLYELDLKYDVFISPVPVSSAAYEIAESPLLINVRREGILVDQEVA